MMNMTKTTALSDRFPEFAPLPTAAADYDIVRRAIAHIRGNSRSQRAIETILDAAGVSATDLHHLFRRWCGLTPKAFLQALTLNYAREPLRASASVLDTAYELGLSGPGRLHDLFVTHEAMSPGEWKAGGEGLTISYGFHPCPFGTALVMNTPRGLAGLALADAGKERSALRDIRAHGRDRPAHLRACGLAPRAAAARGADRHRFRSARVGEAAHRSDGRAHHLFRPRGPRRIAESRARGRRRGRQEPDLLRGAVPPRGRQERRHHRLSLGPHPQARDAGLGSWDGGGLSLRRQIHFRLHRRIRVEPVDHRHAGIQIQFGDALRRVLVEHHHQPAQ